MYSFDLSYPAMSGPALIRIRDKGIWPDMGDSMFNTRSCLPNGVPMSECKLFRRKFDVNV